jgi:hypothetical protein
MVYLIRTPLRSFFYWRILKRQRTDPLQETLVALSRGELSMEVAGQAVKDLIPSDVVSDQGMSYVILYIYYS